jgi:group II intron reverse transcriptase/maturase
MQVSTVQKRLEALPSLSKAGKRVNGLTRLLATQTLMEASVNRTRSNLGSSTPGIDGETLDGLTIKRINGWVRSMTEGSYHACPVKRVYIPKASGKLRPLGIPTYADRMVQNAQREILERIYEPIFSDRSHGFRPERSCHTALSQVQRVWAGTKWFVEVDIKGYFDNIDHNVLLNLLRRRIDDEAFISTIRAQLQAGVMERMVEGAKAKWPKRRWNYRRTYSGTPQGGIVSPILANIYLHELDMFMEQEMASFNQGKSRRAHPEYSRVAHAIGRRRKKMRKAGWEVGHPERQKLIAEIKELTLRARSLPSKDPMDPNYRRLNYVRYADDFLIGVIGTKADAVAMLEKVRSFLKDVLHLEMSEEKTGIVKATKGARFLGYDVRTKTGVKIAKLQQDGFTATKRSSAERIILRTPEDRLANFCHRHGYGDYTRLKGARRGIMVHSTNYEAVNIFNAELRGLANYYQMDAYVKRRMRRLMWIANQSLLITLASKHKTSLTAMLRKMRRGDGRQVIRHEGKDGKVLEVVVWTLRDLGKVGQPARRAEIDMEPVGARLALGSTDVTARLMAGQCENIYCTSPVGTPLQVHHVRAMADVRHAEGLQWIRSARIRKTRYLCINCHPMVKTNARQRQVKYTNGEPDAMKVARPVREEGATRS